VNLREELAVFQDGSSGRVESAATRNEGTRFAGRLAIALLAALALFAFQLARAEAGSAATGVPCPKTGVETLATDQVEYPPGDTVHLTGAGFGVMCDLTIAITRPDGIVVPGEATTDFSGNFAWDYILPEFPGVRGVYGVDTFGVDNTLLASMTFLDASTDLPLRSNLTVGINGGTFSLS